MTLTDLIQQQQKQFPYEVLNITAERAGIGGIHQILIHNEFIEKFYYEKGNTKYMQNVKVSDLLADDWEVV